MSNAEYSAHRDEGRLSSFIHIRKSKLEMNLTETTTAVMGVCWRVCSLEKVGWPEQANMMSEHK